MKINFNRPVWITFNYVAQTIDESLVNKFNYPTAGPKAEKCAVMIASIIKAAQTLPKQSEGRKTEVFRCFVWIKKLVTVAPQPNTLAY